MGETKAKTPPRAALDGDAPKVLADVSDDVFVHKTAKHWIWKDGDWHEEDIPHASDAEYRRMLKHMPATAWNILASAFDQIAFKPAQLDDVTLIKGFLSKITRHPNYPQDVKQAIQRRSQG